VIVIPEDLTFQLLKSPDSARNAKINAPLSLREHHNLRFLQSRKATLELLWLNSIGSYGLAATVY
jgi:hypothetical protein